MAAEGGNSSVTKEYRKGNWTLQETMVLVEAKRMDDERRMKRQSSGDQSKPTELRWKWVEDYCWKNGCFRSQNQCNDKWDNLTRDYKKVRDYQRRLGDDYEISNSSYWKIDKFERKDNNLPTNLSFQIYQALAELLGGNGGGGAAGEVGGGGGAQMRMLVAGGGGDVAGAGGSASALTATTAANIITAGEHWMEKPICSVHSPLPPMALHCTVSASLPTLPPPCSHPLPSPQQPLQPPPPLHYSQPQTSPTVDSDTSDHSDSPAKRRRRRSGGGDEQGTSNTSSLQEVGSAISRSASIIANAIQAGGEREDKRQRELLSFHERRLKLEGSKMEMRRQGINGLVQAINNLANSILTLATKNDQPAPPK
ncbi:hypothetical protein Nepgr_032889 [Nepenthes gracilis]|uniref:Myb-like domain-containing protein n=1 Tax=Nepenthes gracilis TaxID=150966 RepID=A0AAD3TKZ0_NEPGR|nr:hypothetical protein Nepgr_032889 [Nepenthes gracilis]